MVGLNGLATATIIRPATRANPVGPRLDLVDHS